MRSNKFWMILFGAVLIISIVAVLFMSIPGTHQESYAQIFKDGELVETIDLSALSETIEIILSSEHRYNIVQAEPGRVRILDASCSFRLCVRQGWLESGVIPIVCLPNRMSVRLVSAAGQDLDIDGVVG